MVITGSIAVLKKVNFNFAENICFVEPVLEKLALHLSVPAPILTLNAKSETFKIKLGGPHFDIICGETLSQSQNPNSMLTDWKSLLHNFIQQIPNSGSGHVQIFLRWWEPPAMILAGNEDTITTPISIPHEKVRKPKVSVVLVSFVGVVIVSLLLILNIFHTLFYC